MSVTFYTTNQFLASLPESGSPKYKQKQTIKAARNGQPLFVSTFSRLFKRRTVTGVFGTYHNVPVAGSHVVRRIELTFGTVTTSYDEGWKAPVISEKIFQP